MARTTVRELLPAIGAEVLVRMESLDVWMRVIDAKSAYGTERLKITPLNGGGEQWIELRRIVANRESAETGIARRL